MYVTQGEIRAAYETGEDILVVYARRRFLSLGCALLLLLPLTFAAAYGIKCLLGINLFEFHLRDLLL